MGYYVNPIGMTKEEWLEIHGYKIGRRMPKQTSGHTRVVLIDNGAFTAAGIAFDDEEAERFNRIDDFRYKVWYQVLTSDLVEFCPMLL